MIAGKRVAVVVPAHQEEERVGATVSRAPAFVDHVIVVDDASTDGTSEAARATEDPRVVVVRHPRNRGVGAAIATGYRAARDRGADLVAVMAGDGQMDPDDLPALLGPLVDGRADYVKGNRLRRRRAADMPLARRAGSAMLGRATAWAIGVPLGDSQCGYTAITGDMLDALDLERLFPRYGYPNDLLSMVACAGGRIAEVPVRPVYAGERSGLRPWHVTVMLGLIARARARRALGRPREAARVVAPAAE